MKRNIYDISKEFKSNHIDADQFYKELYDAKFASFFTEVRQLQIRMASDSHKITDEELEYIIIQLPLNLLMISENLSELRRTYEVLKSDNRRTKELIRQQVTDELSDKYNYTKAELQNRIASEVTIQMVDYEILLSIYEVIISRVESEISITKELIMGAKKVWDSRRNTERVNPINEVVSEELPEYKINTPKSYIR